MSQSLFVSDPGFCSVCGSIYPFTADANRNKCVLCKTEYSKQALGSMEASYTIHFNSRDKYLDSSDKVESVGPIVERRCPKCGNEKMSYATLQLRSADEGQTVFYTCTKCKYKESENS